jgi:hypothetical protein
MLIRASDHTENNIESDQPKLTTIIQLHISESLKWVTQRGMNPKGLIENGLTVIVCERVPDTPLRGASRKPETSPSPPTSNTIGS